MKQPIKQSITLPSNLRVSYHIYHPQASQTAIFVHGFAGNAAGLRWLLPLLPDIQMIVPDLPGFGESDLPPKRDWTVDGLARLANQFVAALRLSAPPYLAGHSMGGLVAASMLHQQPSYYHPKTILLSPVPQLVGWRDSRRLGMLLGDVHYGVSARAGRPGQRLARSKTITNVISYLMMTAKDKPTRQLVYCHRQDDLTYLSDVRFYAAVYRDTNRRGAVDYQEQLRQRRVLLVSGTSDQVTPTRHMDKLAAAINPAVYIQIPGAGHLLHMEHTAEVAAAINQFIAVKAS